LGKKLTRDIHDFRGQLIRNIEKKQNIIADCSLQEYHGLFLHTAPKTASAELIV